MAHKGYVGMVGEGCYGWMWKPILGPFGPGSGFIRNERDFKVFPTDCGP